MTDAAVAIEALSFRYPEGDFELRVAHLEVARRERVAVLGASGSGKTTLLHLIAGIVPPDAGRIATIGVDLGRLDDAARRDFRIRHVGLVFQEFELVEYLTVLENIMLPYRINASLRLDRAVRERAAALARDAGIADRLGRHVRHLSQGERQRVAVCRALLPQPALLLADEPTGNLDPDNTARILEMLADAAAAADAALVVVTHEHEQLDRFERVIDLAMLDGGAAEDAP